MEIILFGIILAIIILAFFYLLVKGIEFWWNYSTPVHEYEWKYLEADTENQIQPIEIWKDGEYSHTVHVHYFTREQIDKIKDRNIEKIKE